MASNNNKQHHRFTATTVTPSRVSATPPVAAAIAILASSPTNKHKKIMGRTVSLSQPKSQSSPLFSSQRFQMMPSPKIPRHKSMAGPKNNNTPQMMKPSAITRTKSLVTPRTPVRQLMKQSSRYQAQKQQQQQEQQQQELQSPRQRQKQQPQEPQQQRVRKEEARQMKQGEELLLLSSPQRQNKETTITTPTIITIQSPPRRTVSSYSNEDEEYHSQDNDSSPCKTTNTFITSQTPNSFNNVSTMAVREDEARQQQQAQSPPQPAAPPAPKLSPSSPSLHAPISVIEVHDSAEQENNPQSLLNDDYEQRQRNRRRASYVSHCSTLSGSLVDLEPDFPTDFDASIRRKQVRRERRRKAARDNGYSSRNSISHRTGMSTLFSDVSGIQELVPNLYEEDTEHDDPQEEGGGGGGGGEGNETTEQQQQDDGVDALVEVDDEDERDNSTTKTPTSKTTATEEDDDDDDGEQYGQVLNVLGLADEEDGEDDDEDPEDFDNKSSRSTSLFSLYSKLSGLTGKFGDLLQDEEASFENLDDDDDRTVTRRNSIGTANMVLVDPEEEYYLEDDDDHHIFMEDDEEEEEEDDLNYNAVAFAMGNAQEEDDDDDEHDDDLKYNHSPRRGKKEERRGSIPLTIEHPTVVPELESPRPKTPLSPKKKNNNNNPRSQFQRTCSTGTNRVSLASNDGTHTTYPSTEASSSDKEDGFSTEEEDRAGAKLQGEEQEPGNKPRKKTRGRSAVKPGNDNNNKTINTGEVKKDKKVRSNVKIRVHSILKGTRRNLKWRRARPRPPVENVRFQIIMESGKNLEGSTARSTETFADFTSRSKRRQQETILSRVSKTKQAKIGFWLNFLYHSKTGKGSQKALAKLAKRYCVAPPPTKQAQTLAKDSAVVSPTKSSRRSKSKASSENAMIDFFGSGGNQYIRPNLQQQDASDCGEDTLRGLEGMFLPEGMDELRFKHVQLVLEVADVGIEAVREISMQSSRCSRRLAEQLAKMDTQQALEAVLSRW